MAQYDSLAKVTKNNNKGGFTMDNHVVESYGVSIPVDQYDMAEMLLNRLVHDYDMTFEYVGKVYDEILIIVNISGGITINAIIDYLKENL